MKIANILIALLVILLMSLVPVYAERERDYFYEASLNLKTGESTITEKNIMGEKDFSNLPVVVTKTTPDGVTSEIYAGPLSGYDNGKWNNVDFSDNNPLLIYDWQTENYFWVMPKKNTEQAEQQGTNAKETEALSLESNALSASSDWTISSQIKINGVNVGENGLRIIDDASMSCSLSVSNNSDADREITALLATYTSTGALHDINVFNIDVDAQETVNTEIIYEFDAEKEHTGKLMFWDSLSSLIPLRTTIDFSQESGINAYYYNTDNRLLQVDKMNGKSILFTYDNMGNLLTRTVRE